MQTEIEKPSEEWKEVGKLMSASGPNESIGKLGESAKTAFELAVATLREVAELAVQSQAGAFDVVKQRKGDEVAELNAPLCRVAVVLRATVSAFRCPSETFPMLLENGRDRLG
jgi:phasin family protein